MILKGYPKEQPGSAAPETPEPCPACWGTGEVMVGSRHLGHGAVNPDFDTCPKCGGSGVAQ